MSPGQSVLLMTSAQTNFSSIAGVILRSALYRPKGNTQIFKERVKLLLLGGQYTALIRLVNL